MDSTERRESEALRRPSSTPGVIGSPTRRYRSSSTGLVPEARNSPRVDSIYNARSLQSPALSAAMASRSRSDRLSTRSVNRIYSPRPPGVSGAGGTVSTPSATFGPTQSAGFRSARLSSGPRNEPAVLGLRDRDLDSSHNAGIEGRTASGDGRRLSGSRLLITTHNTSDTGSNSTIDSTGVDLIRENLYKFRMGRGLLWFVIGAYLTVAGAPMLGGLILFVAIVYVGHTILELRKLREKMKRSEHRTPSAASPGRSPVTIGRPVSMPVSSANVVGGTVSGSSGTVTGIPTASASATTAVMGRPVTGSAASGGPLSGGAMTSEANNTPVLQIGEANNTTVIGRPPNIRQFDAFGRPLTLPNDSGQRAIIITDAAGEDELVFDPYGSSGSEGTNAVEGTAGPLNTADTSANAIQRTEQNSDGIIDGQRTHPGTQRGEMNSRINSRTRPTGNQQSNQPSFQDLVLEGTMAPSEETSSPGVLSRAATRDDPASRCDPATRYHPPAGTNDPASPTPADDSVSLSCTQHSENAIADSAIADSPSNMPRSGENTNSENQSPSSANAHRESQRDPVQPTQTDTEPIGSDSIVVYAEVD